MGLSNSLSLTNHDSPHPVETTDRSLPALFLPASARTSVFGHNVGFFSALDGISEMAGGSVVRPHQRSNAIKSFSSPVGECSVVKTAIQNVHPASMRLSMRSSTDIAVPLVRSIPPDSSDASTSPSIPSETFILWGRLQNRGTKEINSNKYVRCLPPSNLVSILGTQRIHNFSVPNLIIKGWVIVLPQFPGFAADLARRLSRIPRPRKACTCCRSLGQKGKHIPCQRIHGRRRTTIR
jgi:hypothetical protein